MLLATAIDQVLKSVNVDRRRYKSPIRCVDKPLATHYITDCLPESHINHQVTPLQPAFVALRIKERNQGLARDVLRHYGGTANYPPRQLFFDHYYGIKVRLPVSELVARIAPASEILNRLVVLPGVCKVMDAFHIVHLAAFALAVATSPDGVA